MAGQRWAVFLAAALAFSSPAAGSRIDASQLMELMPESKDESALQTSDTSELLAETRWGAESARRMWVGRKVVVGREFWTSGKESKVKVSRGLKGTVTLVDGDGDSKIDFDGISPAQWVLKSQYENLGQQLVAGDRIVVQSTFNTDDKNTKVSAEKGEMGTVSSVDKDGDASIKFDKHSDYKWVLATNNYQIHTANIKETDGFTMNKKDFRCVACIGFWSTYDPREQYNLKSIKEVLGKCGNTCKNLEKLTHKDIDCIACANFWSTYDARPQYNLRNIDEVFSECPTRCPL